MKNQQETRDMLKKLGNTEKVKWFMAKFDQDDYECFRDIDFEAAKKMMLECFTNRIDFNIDFYHEEN